MPLARNESVFATALPPRQTQQLSPQQINALTGASRQPHRAVTGSRRLAAQIHLVPDPQNRLVGRQSRRDLGITPIGQRLGAIPGHPELHDHIGAHHLLPGALDADALDLIIGRTQPCGIHHHQRHAINLQGLRNPVTRGARHRGHDCHLIARQRIEQARLANIRRTGQHHMQAFAQQGALARLDQQPIE